MKGSSIVRGRGRSRKTIGKTIKKDLEFNGLIVNMIYDRTFWCCLIHVTDPN